MFLLSGKIGADGRQIRADGRREVPDMAIAARQADWDVSVERWRMMVFSSEGDETTPLHKRVKRVCRRASRGKFS